MARPRAFETETALQVAKRLFWARGYEATSLRDLAAETGVKIASLYAAFGDKRRLYRETLKRYIDEMVEALRTRLRPPGPLAERLARPFDATIANGPTAEGCFLINAAAERDPPCPEVRALIAAGFERLAAAFDETLADDPRFRDDELRRSAAQGLVGALIGLKIRAKSGASTETLNAITAQALRGF